MASHSSNLRSSAKTARTPQASRRPRESPESIPHGSYRRYYHRRLNGADPITDDRLPHLLSALSSYSSAKILDIGCNDGVLTAQLAQLKPNCSFTGLDLDPSLISRARRVNKKRVKEEVARLREQRNAGPMFVPLSCKVVQGSRLSSKPSPSDKDTSASSLQENLSSKPPFHDKFPFNISYRCEDIASESPGRVASQVAEYDVVLCLSVTKWVHLHSGDVGLKRLFSRIFAVLKPGGILILEPQPIRSYKRARQRGVEGAHRSFKNELKLKPVQFPSYLTSEKVGFDRFEMLRDKEGKGKHFNRPIYVFHKKGERREVKPAVAQIVEEVLEGVTDEKGVRFVQVGENMDSVVEVRTSAVRKPETNNSVVPEEQVQGGLKRKRSSTLNGREPDGGACRKRPRKDAVGQIAVPNLDSRYSSNALINDDEGENTATAGGKEEGAGREIDGGSASCSAGKEQRVGQAGQERRGGEAEEQEVTEVIDLMTEASSDDQERVCKEDFESK